MRAISIVLVSLAAASSGCFALFSLDAYDDPSPPVDTTPSIDAAPPSPPLDAAPEASAPRRIVFVTSQVFAVGPAGIAGIGSANDACSTAAARAGLAGTFRAWLSTSTRTIGSVYPSFLAPIPIVLVDGAVVADGYTELLTKGPRVPIAITELGSRLPEGAPAQTDLGDCSPDTMIWTGTTRDGGVGATCGDWTNAGERSGAEAGRVTKDPQAWIAMCRIGCNGGARLYCFQQ
jgi:hypothetical protein